MKIIECPRDAMQGLSEFIPTHKKIVYLNQLLKVGFDTIDFGSFVSPKAIPQMRDTAEVLEGLDLSETKSKLLAIVANVRGAEEACKFSAIRYLGFPLSISENFQQRNTNKSISEALNVVNEIQELCEKHNKQQVVYISMGFGNPYGDPYDVGIVEQFSDILSALNVKIISLADTIGVSEPQQIEYLFKSLIKKFPAIEFGAHLHSNPKTSIEKIEAAYNSGCQRFDGALKGFGGCPMAKDELVGNMATETILAFLDSKNDALELNREEFLKALTLVDIVFNH
ncbi:MAG TPA: hydroxymethylglutaryl-CoA lyase [Cyclobacteriaceae bacterium]|jgi:hydroxymethylglutaryl-CoA lyase|nr:hydroxymethylglutaryl-CoA lyase [Cytophagales bacterium]HRE68294.1 hydroxymethylglutaryl-CoA lyase [Cyclobacteriaceae bacterium]HRF34367.1 hydroxymethylglutaryl-CoA lyase [Cyclobacteriaceae bacterium]